VDVLATAVADLKGIARMRRTLAGGRLPSAEVADRFSRGPLPGAASRQLPSFLAIGVVSTVAYLALFALLRGPLGGQGANASALLATAVANTAANRRFTFGVRGRTARTRHQLQGLGVFAIGLALTSCSLAVVSGLDPHPGRAIQIAALLLANLAATAARFALLRGWVFRPAAPASVGGTR